MLYLLWVSACVAAFRSQLRGGPGDQAKVGLIFDSRAALHSGAAPARSGEPGPRILEPGSSKVWYVHIAKSGGMSARQDLPKHLRPVAENAQSDSAHPEFVATERCWPALSPDWDVITIFRNPIAHVRSQWNHCHHDLDHFFAPKDLPETMTSWLRYWVNVGDEPLVRGKEEGEKRPELLGFHCYIPWNLQSRMLSCTGSNRPHDDDLVKLDAWGRYAVNETKALQHVNDLAVAGITEYYHETMCLIHAKYRRTLPKECDCAGAAWKAFPMAHVDHKSGNYREEGQLSGEDLGLIRKLTRADRKVYRAALTRFVDDIRAVEENFGMKILCSNPLEDLAKNF